MSTERNKETVRRFLQAYNEQDMEAFRDFLAPGMTYHNPARPDLHDPDNWIAYHSQVTASYPDRRISAEAMVAEGDLVVLRYTFRGTHLGRSPSLDFPATGKAVAMIGVTIQRLSAGKIIEVWEQWDLYGLMHQLDMLSRQRGA